LGWARWPPRTMAGERDAEEAGAVSRGMQRQAEAVRSGEECRGKYSLRDREERAWFFAVVAKG
jgi:hypothetical protein